MTKLTTTLFFMLLIFALSGCQNSNIFKDKQSDSSIPIKTDTNIDIENNYINSDNIVEQDDILLEKENEDITIEDDIQEPEAILDSLPLAEPIPTPIQYLNLNQSYISEKGMTVTVTSINKTEEAGSYKYTISYTQENKTTDKEIDEGTFKLFFKDGTGLNQFGFFDKLFPSGSKSGTYTFEFLKTLKPFVIEFNDTDSDAGLDGSFFRNKPASETLKWSVK